MRRFLPVIVVLIVALLAPAAASAHARLEGTEPAGGGRRQGRAERGHLRIRRAGRGELRRGPRLRRRRRTGRRGRRLPPGRRRPEARRPPEAGPPRRQLHRHLPGRLRRRPHRLQRLRLLDRQGREGADGDGRRTDRRLGQRQGDRGRLRPRAGPRVHGDRPGGRRRRLSLLLLAARPRRRDRGGGGVAPRRRGRLRQAPAPDPLGRRRPRPPRHRRPDRPRGRRGRRRLRLLRDQQDDRRRDPRNPLRHRLGLRLPRLDRDRDLGAASRTAQCSERAAHCRPAHLPVPLSCSQRPWLKPVPGSPELPRQRHPRRRDGDLAGRPRGAPLRASGRHPLGHHARRPRSASSPGRSAASRHSPSRWSR